MICSSRDVPAFLQVFKRKGSSIYLKLFVAKLGRRFLPSSVLLFVSSSFYGLCSLLRFLPESLIFYNKAFNNISAFYKTVDNSS